MTTIRGAASWSVARLARALLLLGLVCGCESGPEELAFPERFEWGAATAAHQIEGGNTNNNWYQFETLARFSGKTAARSGKAADSYHRYVEDAQLGKKLGLDVYRFSIEWSRIEPRRDQWDEKALDHYDKVIDAVIAHGMRPVVTLHHFTDPIWVHDLSKPKACDKPPSPLPDDNLCGWTHTEVRDEWVEFVEKVVARYGDRVDTWMTFNEPMVVITAGYMFGYFPPGLVAQSFDEVVVPVMRNMIEAHARAYDAIHRIDTKDADGDGKAAFVGFSQSVNHFVPAQAERTKDVQAARQAYYFLNYLFVDALVKGGYDTKLDEKLDEAHPSWKGKLDFVGIQYYYRAPTTRLQVIPPLFFAPCLQQIEALLPNALKLMGCPTPDPSKLTLMGYEHYPQGLYEVGKRFDERYPDLPLIITENGISTNSGERRAQSIVRHLEWAHRLIEEGVDLRGYYHWSLIDNFEWAEGFKQRFGLYRVDFSTFSRTATKGADVYREIIAGDRLTSALRDEYGGSGPLAPEPKKKGE